LFLNTYIVKGVGVAARDSFEIATCE
jgi:hypothetical protein